MKLQGADRSKSSHQIRSVRWLKRVSMWLDEYGRVDGRMWRTHTAFFIAHVHASMHKAHKMKHLQAVSESCTTTTLRTMVTMWTMVWTTTEKRTSQMLDHLVEPNISRALLDAELTVHSWNQTSEFLLTVQWMSWFEGRGPLFWWMIPMDIPTGQGFCLGGGRGNCRWLQSDTFTQYSLSDTEQTRTARHFAQKAQLK